MALTRKQIKEGLDQIPIEQILGGESKQLTAKQRRFARGVAEGKTKAQAYRDAYKSNPSPNTITTHPYDLARDPRIAREIDAYRVAIEGAKYRTPAALRELVIQSLVETLINPEVKEATRVQAAKVLGTVTEVAAFTERKEVRTISSSADAKAQIMDRLRDLVQDKAIDAADLSADSLLAELTQDITQDITLESSEPTTVNHLPVESLPDNDQGTPKGSDQDDPHPTPTPHD